MTALQMTHQKITSKPPRKDVGLGVDSLYPEYAAYTRSEAIARLQVSVPTFNDYRKLAIAHIPDYTAYCEAIWKCRTGRDYMTIRLDKIINHQTPPVIDAPPFFEPQLQVLEAVQGMIRRYGDRRIVIQRLQTHPIWRTKSW